MAYFVKGQIGVDLTVTTAGTGTSSDEGGLFHLGDTVETNEGQTFQYVHASGAIDQYDFVSIDENNEATALADAGGAAGHGIGAAQVALADNAFGWVCINAPSGGVRGNILASCVADVGVLYTTATAGHLDDATSGGAIITRGIVSVASAAAAATNKEVIMVNPSFAA